VRRGCHRVRDSKARPQQGTFLSDGPVKALVDAVYSERLRADLVEALDQVDVKYYEGQLIVDVLEYRGAGFSPDNIEQPSSLAPKGSASKAATPGQPGRTYTPSQHALAAVKNKGAGGLAGDHAHGQPTLFRVVLGRTSQTLWTELGLLFAETGMTQREAVELEGRLLTLTAPPLCLDPSFEVTKIANRMLGETTNPERPVVKRKAEEMATEPDPKQEARKMLQEERERMQQCNPTLGSKFNATCAHSCRVLLRAVLRRTHSFDRFDYVSQWRSDRENRKSHPAPVDPHSAAALPASVASHPALATSAAASYAASLPHLAPGAPGTGSPASTGSAKPNKPKPAKPRGNDAAGGSKVPATKRKKAAAAAAAMAAANRGPGGGGSSITVDGTYGASSSGHPGWA
jgi:hypothetical protein